MWILDILDFVAYVMAKYWIVTTAITMIVGMYFIDAVDEYVYHDDSKILYIDDYRRSK